MTAFDQAWGLLKDFFFEPESARFDEKEVGDKGMKMFRQLMGRFEAPSVNALRESADPSSTWLPPKTFEGGKHHPVILPRTHVMEIDPNYGAVPINVDDYSHFGGKRGLPHYVGVNLSAFGPIMGERTEQEKIDDIIGALVHEHGHAAIDDEMMRTLFENMQKVRTQEEAQQAYNQIMGAHEFGAYTLQNPGGEDAERRARWEIMSHPNWKLANSFKMPKAHINTGDEVMGALR